MRGAGPRRCQRERVAPNVGVVELAPEGDGLRGEARRRSVERADLESNLLDPDVPPHSLQGARAFVGEDDPSLHPDDRSDGSPTAGLTLTTPPEGGAVGVVARLRPDFDRGSASIELKLRRYGDLNPGPSPRQGAALDQAELQRRVHAPYRYGSAASLEFPLSMNRTSCASVRSGASQMLSIRWMTWSGTGRARSPLR